MNNSVPVWMAEETATSILLFKVFWLIGIAVSILCFLTQISLFIFVRASRKADEKILAQITVTRILVTLCEYYLIYIPKKTVLSNDIVFGLYFTTDIALVCLMLLFTKNLYDKIVVVFSTRKLKLIYISIIIWGISLLFGFAGVYILKYHIQNFELFAVLIFAVTKFIIASLNIMFYINIFYVAFMRGVESNRNIRDVLKTAFVAFFLVTTTCLQIVITDLIAYGKNRPIILVKGFCVINSFHVVLITVIFVIILKSKMNDTIVKTVSLRLTELVT